MNDNLTKSNNVTKKVLVFDLETTGTDKSKDRVIEFGGMVFDWEKFKSFPPGMSPEDYKNAAEKSVKKFFLPDDGTEVSIGAYAKHRLKRETLKDFPGFGTFVDELVGLLDECSVIVTYNGMSFDIPMLTAELRRYGVTVKWEEKEFYDAFKTETLRNSNKLEATYARYAGKTMEEAGLEAHDAFADIIGTATVFNAQNVDGLQETYDYITDDGFLAIGEWENRKCVLINNGKYHGIPLREVAKCDVAYLRWVLGASFSERTKQVVTEAIQRFGKK